MATVTAELKINVLEAALANTPSIHICRENSITPDLMRSILSTHGWPNRKTVQWRLDILREDVNNGAASNDDLQTYEVADGPEAPVAPAPKSSAAASQDGPCEHINLLRAGSRSTRTRTRNLGVKIEALLTELQTALVDERRARAAKDAAARAATKAKEAARAKAAAERARAAAAARATKDAVRARDALARLEEQEARIKADKVAAQARLDAANEAAKNAPVSTAPAETPSSQIRAWAAANDVDCPAVGRVPNAVREAYEKAHPKGAAA